MVKIQNSILNATIPVTKKERDRLFFTEKQGKSLPNLIEVQLDSYKWFLEEGIQELLNEISPIEDFSGKKLLLSFLSYKIETPKYSPKEAKQKNISYEAQIKARLQLVNKKTGEIKEQDVYLGNIPLMTNYGTFIINGIERVVVSQLVRSPGAFFGHSQSVPGKFNAKIIPRRGAWLELETDKKGIIYAKIDRKRKFPVTQFLRVFGLDTERKMLEEFADVLSVDKDNVIQNTLEKDSTKTVEEAYQSIYKKIRPGDLATPDNAKALVESTFFDYKRYDMGPVARYKLNKRFGFDTPDTIETRVLQIKDFFAVVKHLIKLNNKEGIPDDIDHLSNRRVRSVGELVQNKYRIGLMRMERIVKDRMSVMDLEQVVPMQLVNARPITASMREFFASSQLSQFMDQTNPLSELAHKRRLSAMGPGGLSRERASFDVRDVHVSHYGRICPVATPEGPNIGLVLHLASYAKVNQHGFIETPFKCVYNKVNIKEQSNYLVGRVLDEDLENVASVGDKITEDIAKKIITAKISSVKVVPFAAEEDEYFDADNEHALVIAQANSVLDVDNNFTTTLVAARQHGEAIFVDTKKVTHIDVSPKQILSEGTALIPFLEHDDNTRASMGANMQRQAVSLVAPSSPIVGTGLEKTVAEASGQVIIAKEDGVINYADANEVKIVYNDGKIEEYVLDVYKRSNQATSVHMKTKVVTGQKINKGDVLVDGASVDKGELSLGQNLLVAYMTWRGYNFEDAIIISDRVVRHGQYDSIHIEEYIIDVRDTKLGPEIMTRDIPNVGEVKLKDLDAEGIVRIGAFVKEGDILVGKITPKGETELTPEERLLHAIFGDMAKDVKDSSLRLPGGEGGKVIDVQILTRKDGDDLPTSVIKQVRVIVAQQRQLQVGDKMAGRHGNKGVVSRIVAQEDMPFLEDGTPMDLILNPLGVASRMNIGQVLEAHLGLVAKKMGIRVATPALNGVRPQMIQQLMRDVNLPDDGKLQLYDGMTGEKFTNKTMVGITYMLKLSHLVEDKIHARSVGPYSLVTQQPLGGKAQHGGQRFGEMEVWALEAYGAAHTLQEMLTIKSDDVLGRSKAYEDIVKGQSIREPSIPESFNVLVRELQALCLNVELLSNYEEDHDLDEIDHIDLPSELMELEDIPDEDEIDELLDSEEEEEEDLEEQLNGDEVFEEEDDYDDNSGLSDEIDMSDPEDFVS